MKQLPVLNQGSPMSNQRPVFASLTRISDLETSPFEIQCFPQEHWQTGDYVVSTVTSIANYHSRVELANGRMVEVVHGDLLVGALGVRAATLEAVGSWRDVKGDGKMQALTGAGLFGRATSISPYIQKLLDLEYQGHVVRNGQKIGMRDFVQPAGSVNYNIPTVLIIGTSMSSGKTTVGKVIVRQLSRSGLKVAAVKLTGAGRFRDTLAMRDAGADIIYDFVDAGLPSTVCPPAEYRDSLSVVLKKLVEAAPDVVVAEAGASPLEPYSGDVLIEEIRDQVKFTVLCASDPYAVVGVTQGFGFQPDLVAGIATTTSSAVQLVEKLTGIRALNLLDPDSHSELCRLLETKFGV
jgi:hypothetical protein